MLGDGVRITEIWLSASSRDVDRHIAQLLDAQLRIVINPTLAIQRAPHCLGVVSTAVGKRDLNGFWHALAGGIQVSGERASKIEQVRVTLCHVDSRSCAHGQTRNCALLIGTELVVHDWDNFFGQERLPLVVLAVVRLLPIGIERRLATDRQDDVDVFVSKVTFHIGRDGPPRFGFAGAQTVHQPQFREFLVRLSVVITGQQHLELHFLVRHSSGFNVDECVAR